MSFTRRDYDPWASFTAATITSAMVYRWALANPPITVLASPKPASAWVKRCNELGIAVDVSHLNYKGFWDVANNTDHPMIATHSCVYNLCNSPRNLMDDQLDAIAQTGGIVGANFFIGFLNEEGSWDKPTPVSCLVDHIDYMVDRMGIDHVGFGSDYGVIPAPIDMPDISTYPVLMDALRERGYDDEALHKLAHGNWLRVLKATWASENGAE